MRHTRLVSDWSSDVCSSDLAEDEGGNVLGFATGYEKKGIPQEVLLSWKAKRVGYLDLMAVDILHRKQGIGTALLNSVLDQFKGQEIGRASCREVRETDEAYEIGQ